MIPVWLIAPTILMVALFLWAIFWPASCDTWHCWPELITRLLFALLASMIAWIIAGAYK